MGKATVIKLPNGTIIELSPEMSPEQITALVSAVSSPTISNSSVLESKIDTTQPERTSAEIWESSKKERLALFLRNYISDSIWFTAKQIQELQLAETGTLALGETSAIATYLSRLSESGYLDRMKDHKGVQYKIMPLLANHYPVIEQEQMAQLMQIH